MSDECGCGTTGAAARSSAGTESSGGGSADAGSTDPDARRSARPRPSKESDLANDGRTNPFADGVDRRLLRTTGAVAGTARPEGDAVASVQASLASHGIAFGDMEATCSMDDHCYCG